MDKLQVVQDKLADLNDEFTTERITREEFKRLAGQWIEFLVTLDVQPKDAPISLFDYIRVRYGKF